MQKHKEYKAESAAKSSGLCVPRRVSDDPLAFESIPLTGWVY